jgi:hypothetical protein
MRSRGSVWKALAESLAWERLRIATVEMRRDERLGAVARA